MADCVIEIVSLADSKRILKPGELGEICIRGPQVMAGYWKQPKETTAVLHRGRLHTGDFGYLDRDGYLFIVDRLKEIIISGGFNVYPRMVEEALTLHPAVAQAVVYGVPDQHRGERVKGPASAQNSSTPLTVSRTRPTTAAGVR